jgi:hypothetical protein
VAFSTQNSTKWHTALILFIVTISPILLGHGIWLELWQNALPQAWDGSGHFALARIYSETVFPNTFGWTGAIFSGVALPNYYPPLSYWLVAMLSRSHLLPFAAAFKLVLALPTLMLPAAVWLLARQLFARGPLAPACAAFALVPLLVDVRLTNSSGLMGLSYASTFLLGLYTQPLGFVLLLAWYYSYSAPDSGRRPWRDALSCLLLALALLANFFGATVAALLVIATLIYDALRIARSTDASLRRRSLRALASHLISPLAALCLTLFWLVPLASTYRYVVARPERSTLEQLVPAGLWAWYALAALGAVLWLRRPAVPGAAYPYLAACLALAACVFLPDALAPGWFPFHAPRLASTLDFMLAAPVGNALASALRVIIPRARDGEESHEVHAGCASRMSLFTTARLRYAFAAALALAAVVLLFVFIRPAPERWAFYDAAEWARVAPVLDFARAHRDGRYLVEVQPMDDIDAAHDGRAISAYLGAQGDESLSHFFREAAPNALFLNPLAGALSGVVDAYGLSSVLADDTDFIRQPLSQHVAQARLYGARYFVVRSRASKERLAREGVPSLFDSGEWDVFDLGGGPQPLARALPYKPALVAGGLNLKLRRRNDYGFVRLAEEQFSSGWYDVLLARAPDTRLDRLDVPQGFGALVVDGYDYDDEARAYERLKEFSRERPLILLSSDSPLFLRIRSAASEFAHLQIVERPREGEGQWLESDHPTTSYATSGARRVWNDLRQVLDQEKVPVTSAPSSVVYNAGQGTIDLNAEAPVPEAVPVLVSNSFHPDWRRTDGGTLYAATPFLTLTFVGGPTRMTFARSRLDALGLWASAATLLLLVSALGWHYRGRTSALVKWTVGRSRKEEASTGRRLAGGP